VNEGYAYKFNENLVTIWSAPNYSYRCGNSAAILSLDENMNKDWIIFKEAEKSSKSTHPKKVLPYFL